MHHFGVDARSGDVERDGALDAVEVVVEAGGRIDEQRRGDTLEAQRAAQFGEEVLLDDADGALRLIQPPAAWNTPSE